MATVIEKAVKGKQKAIEFLYDTNKQKVYYVALLLLGNEADAAEAVSFTFKNIWSMMTAHGITSEEGFQHLAIRKVTSYCKRKLGKQNQKVFRAPQNHNFFISGDKYFIEGGKQSSSDILALLPPLQRFILVLHSVGEYLPEQIASTFQFDMKTVNLALEAEQTNIEKILKCNSTEQHDYEWLLNEMINGEEKVTVPATVDECIATVIDDIAMPIEKKRKKRIVLAGVIAIVLCLAIVGGIFFATRLPVATALR